MQCVTLQGNADLERNLRGQEIDTCHQPMYLGVLLAEKVVFLMNVLCTFFHSTFMILRAYIIIQGRFPTTKTCPHWCIYISPDLSDLPRNVRFSEVTLFGPQWNNAHAVKVSTFHRFHTDALDPHNAPPYPFQVSRHYPLRLLWILTGCEQNFHTLSSFQKARALPRNPFRLFKPLAFLLRTRVERSKNCQPPFAQPSLRFYGKWNFRCDGSSNDLLTTLICEFFTIWGTTIR